MKINRHLIRRVENFVFFALKKRNWEYLFNYSKNYEILDEIIKHNKNRKILISYSMPFNCTLFQRPQQLAIELSKFDLLYLYGEQKNTKTYKVNDNLIISNFDLINKICIKNNAKPYLFITSTSPNSLKKILYLKNHGYQIVYEYIDEMTDEIHDTKESKKIFDNLDKINPVFCLATSERLKNQLEEKISPEKIFINKNAVKIEDFLDEEYKIPDDMQKIIDLGKPIVGYYGALALWLDYDLLNKLSKERPEYNFVFIGSDFKGLDKLEKRENVFYLGEKEYKELYKYSKNFDCAIIPFKEGDIAKATSPLKLFEFMAMKKTVVCTKDLDECKGYEGVFIAKDTKEFIEYVDKAIAVSKDENLKEILFGYAKQNTWHRRCIDIIKNLEGETNEN